MAYGSEARLPSDQACIEFDKSPENIELTFRQRNLAVRKLDKTWKELITNLITQLPRDTPLLRTFTQKEISDLETECSEASKANFQNSTPNGMGHSSSETHTPMVHSV